MKNWFNCFYLLCMFAGAGFSAAEAKPAAESIRIVTSIKPLALIAQDLLAERAEVSVLVPANATPHHYSLKTSDMRRLQEAELVVWLGPSLERFLSKPLAALPAERRLSLGGVDGAAADHLHAEASHDDHSHSEDLHLWLDPQWATLAASTIAQRVAEQRPEWQPELTRKLAALREDYAALAEELGRQLAPLQQQGFVVYHRGYQSLVQRYQLHQVGWVTINPDQPAGIKHLLALERQLAAVEPPVSCLVVDQSHFNGGVEKLARQLKLQVQEVDLLAVAPELQSYPQLMTRLAQQLLACVPTESTQ